MQIDHKVNNHICCMMTLLFTIYHVNSSNLLSGYN